MHFLIGINSGFFCKISQLRLLSCVVVSSFVQIGESAGPECKAVLQEITKLVDKQLQSDGYNTKSLFGAATVFLIKFFVEKFIVCLSKPQSIT